MERYLKSGQTLCLDGKEFIIDGIIGKGSSCVVYHAKCHDDTEHLIKEYNPSEIEIYRNENGDFEVDNEEDAEKYNYGLKRFIKGSEKQREIRLSPQLKNSTTNVQEVYDAYGTHYIDMTPFTGETYEKVNGETLNVILIRAKSLAQIIGNYHKAGLLHLDIKPENIFTIPESVDFIMLFDFDSVVEKSDLPYGATLSYTKSWAAPEQLLPGRQNKICEATDIFAIGEIVFYKIFGRHSSLEEKRSFAEYQYNFESQALKNVNPKVKPLLDELFHHTICSNVKKRYQSAEDLTEILDNLIKISDTEKQYIKTSLPEPEAFFVGRDREISEIGKKLQENRILYLSGIGGIGKSELAKQYAKKALKNGRYDTVLFMPFVTDTASMIINDNTVPIYNFFRYPEEDIKEYYNSKMRKLNELCDNKTLIIIDNFDIDDVKNIYDEFKRIKEFNCDVLITTRFDFNGTNSTEEYVQYRLNKIDNEKDIINIFNQYYTKPIGETEKEQIKEIIAIVDGHTLAVELLAKQMTAGRVKPEKMLEKLKEGGIEQSGNESVLSVKDGDISRKNTYTHIKALFDISGLSEQEQYVLANLSLIPHTGISTELFHDWCELESYEEINTLSISGWIRWDKENDIISLPPVVADVVVELLTNKKSKIEHLLNSCVLEIKNKKQYVEESTTNKNMKSHIWFFIAKKLLLIDLKEAGCSKLLGSCFWTDNILDIENYYFWVEQFYNKAFSVINNSLENNKDFLEICNNLCVLNINICNYQQAEVYCKKVLEAQNKIDKTNHLDLGKIYNNFGVIYTNISKYDLAEEYLLKSIKEFSQANDCDDKTFNLVNTYNSLGSLYDCEMKFKEAENVYLKGIEVSFSQSDNPIIDVAYLYNNLGKLYAEMNQDNRADEYYKKALTLRIDILGENSGEVSDSYLGIGNFYMEKRIDLIKAKEYILKSINIREKIYGKNNARLAYCYNSLAGCYDNIGDIANAEKYFKIAISVMTASLGEFHIDIAHLYTNLGALYVENNNIKDAEVSLHKALKIYDNQVEEYPSINYVYFWLAQLYYKESNVSKAYDYMKKAFDILKNTYGANNPNTIKAKELLDEYQKSM